MDRTSLERLLAERAWLKRLAVGLTRDPHVADDLTQDTYVAALERAPSVVERPRAWMGTVVRNLAHNRARADRRRRAREEAQPTRDLPDAPDRLVEQAELVEKVARAVLRLPEPQRTTVLLRYFEDEPPRRIARRMGVPVATVRTRLRRALHALAREMDDASHGDRRRWAVPLAVWAGNGVVPGTAGTMSGILAMKKTVVVAILVLAAALATWRVVGTGLGRGENPPLTDEGSDGVESADAGAKEVDDPVLKGSADREDAGGREAGGARTKVAEEGIVLEGIVVRRDGRPAAGVTVEARSLTRRSPSVRTGEAGAYSLLVGPWPTGLRERVAVRAAGTGGLAGMAGRDLWPGMPSRASVSPIVLEPATSLRIRVEHDGEPVATARVAVSELHMRSWYGIVEVRTDGEGQARVDGLVEGSFRVDASHPRHGRATSVVTLPPDGRDVITLTLRPASHTLEVRVVENGTGTAIEGARVELYEAHGPEGAGPGRLGERGPYLPAPDVPLTDAEGRTRIEGLDPSTRLVVVAESEGRPPQAPVMAVGWGGWSFVPPKAVPAGANEVTIEVPRRTEARWPVADGEVAAPPDGTSVEVRHLDTGGTTRAIEGRIEGGHLIASAYPDLGFRGVALAPDGTRAYVWLRRGESQGEEITFWRPRRIEVVLRYGDGRPAPGIRVQLGASPPLTAEPMATDEAGRALFESLNQKSRYRVHLVPPFCETAWTNEPPLGTITCGDDGAGRLEATVHPEREVAVAFRVAGKPFLPADLSLGRGANGVTSMVRHAERGEVRFHVRPDHLGPPLHFRVSAKGYAPAHFRVPADGETSRVERAVDLVPTGSLFVRVLPPPDRESRVQVHRWVPESGTWTHGGLRRDRDSRLPDLRIFTGLRSGRHRVVDTLSGVVTKPFDVDVAAPPGEVTIDLGSVVEVSGRVSVPEGFLARQTLIVVEDRPRSLWEVPVPSSEPTLPVGRDGSFSLRLPKDGTATLRPWHPQLGLAGGRERIVVRAAEAPLRIRFFEGTQAFLRFHPDTMPEDSGTPRGTPVVVHLYAGAPLGEPLHVYELTLDDGEVTFGGFAPGTYSVWVNAWPYVPLLFEGVELGEGGTDLGEARLEEGGRVRLRLLLEPGAPLPLFQLSAHAREEPVYWRTAHRTEGTEVVLFGLRPGRYRVTGMLNVGGRHVFDETIRVPKDAEIVREADLR